MDLNFFVKVLLLPLSFFDLWINNEEPTPSWFFIGRPVDIIEEIETKIFKNSITITKSETIEITLKFHRQGYKVFDLIVIANSKFRLL